MEYIYTDRRGKSPKRTVITAEQPLKFRVILNATHHAAILLFHKGQRRLIAQSRDLQNQYLFLSPETCQELYEEAVAAILLEARSSAEAVDMDEILSRVIRQHEQELDAKAIRVELSFPQKDAFHQELLQLTAVTLQDEKRMSRYHKEKRLLKQLIQKYSAAKGRSPEESVLEAVMALSHARFASGHPGMARSQQQFRQWLCALFTPDDLAALVQFCTRPELSGNHYLEVMLHILLHNCPAHSAVCTGI